MKRQHSELILEILATTSALVSFYACNPIVGIAVTPLAIYCLLEKYTDKNDDENKDDNEEE